MTYNKYTAAHRWRQSTTTPAAPSRAERNATGRCVFAILLSTQPIGDRRYRTLGSCCNCSAAVQRLSLSLQSCRNCKSVHRRWFHIRKSGRPMAAQLRLTKDKKLKTQSRYRHAATAATAPSLMAVAIWRTCLVRQSPATKIPLPTVQPSSLTT